MLKPNAVPTLNLTANTQKVKSIAAINRAKKMEARSIKQVNFYIFIFLIKHKLLNGFIKLLLTFIIHKYVELVEQEIVNIIYS